MVGVHGSLNILDHKNGSLSFEPNLLQNLEIVSNISPI